MVPCALDAVLKARWTALVKLNLSNAGLCSDCMLYIVEAPLVMLQDLDVSYNWFGLRGIAYLSAACWPQLTRLILNSSFGQSAIGGPAMEAWPQLALGLWPQLAELDLSNNNLPASLALQQLLGQWPAMTHLKLSCGSCKLQPCLCDINSRTTALQSLDLSCCYMDTLIDRDLKVWSFLHLTTLNLYNNKLSLGSVQALVWSQCPMLAYLDLGCNNLQDYIAFLAQAYWPWLSELRLAGNNNQGVLQLANAN